MIPFFRRVDLSSRPLFLLCGGDGGGKTTLLAKSGLACEYLYHGDGGSSTAKNGTPEWFFSENAVYVSGIGGLGEIMPQEQAESGDKKQKAKKPRKKKQAAPVKRLEAFYSELKKNRLWRRRAIDGALLVVDIDSIIKSDVARINQIAAELRGQADAIVSMTGYRIPIYFIFNKSDKIEGFRELFSDKSIVERMPCVGALAYGDRASKLSPKEHFLSRYKKVYDNLTDLSVLGLVNANRRELLDKQPGALNDRAVSHESVKTGVAGERVAICRLTQEFLLAESKLSTLVEVFFGERGLDRPQFGGFFFTSSKMETANEPDIPAVFSNRVLFGEVIPGAKHTMREAGEGTLFHRVKKIGRILLVVLLWAIISILFPGSALRDAWHIRTVTTELSELFEDEPTLENQYAALSTLLRSYDFLKHKFIPPGRVIFQTGKAHTAVKDVYITAAREVLVKLAAERLELSIMQKAERRSEPTIEEYQSLYRSLEAYLLLTGGYPPNASTLDFEPIAEVVMQSLKIALGQHYNTIGSNVLQNNVNAAIRFAADGFLFVLPNEKVIAAAREQLARSPRAETVYASKMESLRTPHRAVPINRIVGKTEIVQYGREVSALYTREGWEQIVYAALIDASKNPYKNNWVTGLERAPVDEEKLLPELVTLYVNDMRGRWLDFIRAATVNLQFDMTAFAGDLEKISSQKSEIGRTLAVVCSLATQPPRDVAVPEMPSKKTSIASIKGQVSGLTNKLRGDLLNFAGDIPDPFVEAKKTFGPIDEFLTGDGFLNYRNDLGELSKTMKQCAERGGFSAVFVPRGESPMSQSRKNLARVYINMPDEALVVKRLLDAPFDHAATTLAMAVSAELDGAWSGEVTKYFNEKLAARYPFEKDAPDVPYGDFEEFFKPQTGVIWKHINQKLSGIIERTPNNGWMPVATLPLPIVVSEETLRCINRADKIAAAFFKDDGSTSQDITFSPFISSFGTARFAIGEKSFDFSGGLPVTVNRAPNADEAVILRTVSGIGKDAGEIRFTGEWALAHLFEAAKIESLGRGRYKARWSVNVQNIYTAHVTSIVQSNIATLFDQSTIRGFNVPNRVLRR